METVELLGINGGFETAKFINVLKEYTSYTTIEILNVLNQLDNGKPITIELKPKEIVDYNQMVSKLTNLNINLGESSFRQEENFI